MQQTKGPSTFSEYIKKFDELKTVFDSLPDGIVALLNGCQPEHQLRAEEYLKQGVYFEKSEQYNNAIRTYTKALEINSVTSKPIKNEERFGVKRKTSIKLSLILPRQ